MKRLFNNRAEIFLFLILFVTYAYFFTQAPGWNVNSRINLTYSIVDEFSFAIDSYHNQPGFDTGDKAYVPQKGHYYSDKIPGLSFLGAVPYGVLKLFTDPFEIETKPNFSRYFTTLVSVSLLSAYLFVIFRRMLLLFGADEKSSYLLTFILAFGTSCFAYSTVFFPYQPSMLFFVSAYYIVWKSKFEKKLDDVNIFLPGLLCGFAMLFEYTSAVIAGVLWWYILILIKNKWKIVSFSVGCVLPLLSFFIYNYICFENPFTIPYEYLEWDFFRESMQKGFMGISRLNPVALYYITVHPYKGIFIATPVLLLIFVSAPMFLKRKEFRPEISICIGLVIFYFVFNASYYMWWGGWAAGARHLIPMLPFAFILLIPVVKKIRFVVIVLGILSIALGFMVASVDPQPRQLYETKYLLNPKMEYNFKSPLFREGVRPFIKGELGYNIGQSVGLKGHLSLLPLLIVDAGLLFGLWRILREKKRPDQP